MTFKDLPVGAIFYGRPYNDGLPRLMQKLIRVVVTQMDGKKTTEEIICFSHWGNSGIRDWEPDSQYPIVERVVKSFIVNWDIQQMDTKQIAGKTAKFIIQKEHNTYPGLHPYELCYKHVNKYNDYRDHEDIKVIERILD